MAAWVFCVSCNSTVSNGDFNDGALWWNATTGASTPVGTNRPFFVPQMQVNDTVYYAVQVDSAGSGNGLVQDLRAAVGRRRQGATISSPFKNGNFTLQSVGGVPSALSIPGATNPPAGSWTTVGPFTVNKDPGKSGARSRYAFVLTTTLSNGAQFGEDPEMDVDNGV